MPATILLRFDRFLLDPASHRLEREGEEVVLSPKAFELLCHLVRERHRVVTKTELLDTLWPGTAVTENSLAQRVSEIREVLGDQIQHPRYLRTIPRVGYQFVAEVDERPRIASRGGLETAANEVTTLPPPVPVARASEAPVAGRLRWPGRHATAAAAVIAAVAVLAGAWYASRARRGAAPASEQRLISTFAGQHRTASFSPDGAFIAFAQPDADGVSQIWVKNLAQGHPVQITTGPDAAYRPRWSPSNDRIVFARRDRGIWAVPPLGGAARQVIENGTNPDLSSDGRRIVFERDGTIWIGSSDGTDLREVAGVPRRVYSIDYAPAISPDGRWIALFRAELGPNGDLWVVPAEGGEARRLTFDLREGGTPAWTPDSQSIIFSSARAGSRTLWRVPVSGGTPEPVTTGAGEDIEPAVSPDGTQLVYTNVRNTWGLRLLDPATGAQREILERRLGILWPMFSPSGDRIAFFGSDARGDAQVFVIDRDGTEAVQITRGPGEMNTMPRWMPDDTSLLVYQMQPRRALRKVVIETGTATTELPWDWEREGWAVPDPRGARLVYTLIRNFRPEATRVHELASGREWPLDRALDRPRWSPDGAAIAGAAGGRIVVCATAGRPCREVTDGFAAAWSGDGAHLYFLRAAPARGSFALWQIGVDGSAARELASVGPFRSIDVHFDVSRRDEIVWTEFREGRHELWMGRLQ